MELTLGPLAAPRPARNETAFSRDLPGSPPARRTTRPFRAATPWRISKPLPFAQRTGPAEMSGSTERLRSNPWGTMLRVACEKGVFHFRGHPAFVKLIITFAAQREKGGKPHAPLNISKYLQDLNPFKRIRAPLFLPSSSSAFRACSPLHLSRRSRFRAHMANIPSSLRAISAPNRAASSQSSF